MNDEDRTHNRLLADRPASRSLLWGLLSMLMVVGSLSCGPTDEDDSLDARDACALCAGGKADAFGLVEGSAEARGILAVANTLSEQALDDDVGLHALAAANIVQQRGAGLQSLTELDAVPWVGANAFARLLDYARENGYVSAAPPSDAPAGWTAGASTAFRTSFAATLLTDGRLLVTGGDAGYQNGYHTSKVELYDPAADSWQPAASLLTRRQDHSATRLADGRVWVAGGRGSDSSSQAKPLSTSELYDPISDSWRATATLNSQRYHHTATLLADGRVLLLGGQYKPDAYTVVKTEIYDPASYSVSQAAPLPTGRQQHTAHLLPDGRVLVVGGYNRALKRGVPEVLVYDPPSDSWQYLGELELPRWNHAAVLLPGPRLLIFGGESSYYGVESHAEVIDLAAQTIEPLPPLGYARAGLSATLLGDQVVIIGGGQDHEPAGDPRPPVELYQAATRAWYQSSPLPRELVYHRALATAAQEVVVLGAVDDQSSPGLQALTYRPQQGQPLVQPPPVTADHWVSAANRHQQIKTPHHTVAFHHGRGQLIAFSGRQAENVPVATYAWQDGGWQEVLDASQSPVPPRAGHTLAYDRARDVLVLFGGMKRAGFYLNDVWELDGSTWVKREPVDGFSPPVSAGALLVYDTSRQELLLLPGSVDLEQQRTVYRWDGARWTEKGQAGSLQPWTDQRRYDAAFDEGRGVLVLYQQGPYLTAHDETWEFNGSSWRCDYHTGNLGNRHSVAMAYDPVRGGVVLFGGDQYSRYGGSLTQSDTWLFDGAWQKLSPQGDPGTRAGHTLYFDPLSDSLVVEGVGWPAGNSRRLALKAIPLPNRAPQMNALYPKTQVLHAGQSFTLALDIKDADGHPLEIWAEGLPAGASYTLDAAAFVWTPTVAQAGSYSVSFHASDGARETVRQLVLQVDAPYPYAGLPEGSIDHHGSVSVGGSWGESYSELKPATFAVICAFSGQNPGLVTVRCQVKEPDWPYSVRPAGEGTLAADSTFSTGQVWGRVQALQWDDYQLVITQVDAQPYSNRQATFNGEATGYLNPLP